MKSFRTLNPPTKALLVLLIPAIYLLILNKSLWFILYLTFNMSVKEYSESNLIILLNIGAGLFFLLETAVFLYDRKRNNNGY